MLVAELAAEFERRGMGAKMIVDPMEAPACRLSWVAWPVVRLMSDERVLAGS